MEFASFNFSNPDSMRVNCYWNHAYFEAQPRLPEWTALTRSDVPLRRFDRKIWHQRLDVPIKFNSYVAAVAQNHSLFRSGFMSHRPKRDSFLVQLDLDRVTGAN